MTKNKKSLVKQLCICCGEKGKKTNKEHIFPVWMLKKTNTYNNPIKGTAGNKKISGKKCVIPICEKCNSEFGEQLEEPVSKVFEKIEKNEGFNDYEAGLLVRWMWKITGMLYWIEKAKTQEDYGFIQLKDKCLKSIERSRDRISIAVSLIENEISDQYEDTAMGIDVIPELSNILAAGVFNKTALIVYYTKFEILIPNNFTKYQLSSAPILMNPEYVIKPVTGFLEQEEAITTVIRLANGILLNMHEVEAVKQIEGIKEAAKSNDSSFPNEFTDYIKKVEKNHDKNNNSTIINLNYPYHIRMQ